MTTCLGCGMVTGSEHQWCVRCRPMDHYVPSPCRNVCVVERDTCVGCNRTILEIARWSRASRDEKMAILARIDRASGPST